MTRPHWVKYANKISVWLIFGFLALWFLVILTGIRLPYIYTEFAFRIRAYFLFPLLFGTIGYFAFIYRRANGSTGYMQAINRLPTRSEKVKQTLWGLFGWVLISSGIVWTSVGITAWATHIFSQKHYTNSFQITKIKARSGTGWSRIFDLGLIDKTTDEKVTLRLNRARFEQNHWKVGEEICVKGRKSIFGTIIDFEDRCKTISGSVNF